MQSGIYQIICLVNGKNYVGSAVNLKERWRLHKVNLRKNKGENRYLQNSWNKYGEEFFEFVIIEYCEKEILIEREQHYLDYFESYKRKNGYNIRIIADSCLGIKRSQETIDKLKGNQNCKGKQNSLGYQHTLEARLKISQSLIGHQRNIGKPAHNRMFSQENIEEIRKELKIKSVQQVAFEVGVNVSTIYRIKNNTHYKKNISFKF